MQRRRLADASSDRPAGVASSTGSLVIGGGSNTLGEVLGLSIRLFRHFNDFYRLEHTQ